MRLVALWGVVCAAGLTGCAASHSARTELEHHDARVRPTYSAAMVELDSSPVVGQGAPYAAAPSGHE